MLDDSTTLTTGLPAVADTRPSFGYTSRTHDYWYAKIVDSINRLEISDRAQRARDRKRKYQEYDFGQKNANRPTQTVNAISRQINTFINNTVTDNPVCTPQFYQQHEEDEWRYKLKSFMDANIRGNDIKSILVQMMWDCAYADIAWLKADWRTQFVDGTPTNEADAKRKELQETATIDQEHAAIGMGMAVPTKPEDWHEFHIAKHTSQKEAADLAVEMATNAQQMGLDDGSMAQAAQSQATLLGLHIDEHNKAARSVESERFEALRWPPYLVYYDPDAGTWEDADWYALDVTERKEVLMARSDLRGVRKLKGVAGRFVDEFHEERQNATGMSPPAENGSGAPTESYIRHFIVHDRVGNNLIYIADHEYAGQIPLLFTDWPFEGDLVAPLVIRGVNDQVHGVPIIHIMEFVHDQLRSIQDRIAAYSDKIPPAKVFIEKNLMTDEVKSAMSDVNKMFVPVSGIPKEKLMPWNAPPIDNSLLEERTRLENELQLESGIPEVYNAGDTNETATATAVRDRQAGNKIGDAKQKIAKLVQWYCDTLINTFRLHGTNEQWVRVVGDSGLSFDKITPGSIPRDVYWMVDADSLSPSKREMEKKQAMELLNVLTPFAPMLPGFTDLLISIVGKFDVMENPALLKEMPGGMQPMMPGMGMQQPGMGMPPMSPGGQLGNEAGAQQGQAATI